MKKIFIALACFTFATCIYSEHNEKPTVKNGEVKIAYTENGKGDTALVFVHGWAINKEYFQKQIDHFSDRYIVITLDLGGHGESGLNRNVWTIDDFAGDVIAVIDSLHLNKVILIGHSMAGGIIINVASKTPSKIIGLIGIDNFKNVSSILTQEQQQQIDTFMKAVRTNYKQTAVTFSKAALFPPNYADTVSVNRVLHNIENTDSIVAIEAIQADIDFSTKEPDYLSELHVPLHLIVSDYTPTNEDSLRQYCKAGYFIKTIHGTGHYPMIEKPDEFNKLLDETIADISKGK
jgi:sigma-B regulation protein RsbQ